MSEFISYLREQVENGAIYVWGAQGKNLSEMDNPEAWIRTRETKPVNQERAIATYRARVAAGYTNIRAFDCSGLIMYFLQNMKKVFSHDLNAQGLYNKCNFHPSINELEAGDLVFKGTSEKAITHIGVYISKDEVIEAKGRDDGVVARSFAAGGWKYYGCLDELEPYVHDKSPITFAVETPMLQGDAYNVMQEALRLAGYTDYEDKRLSPNGKWGKRSQAAFEKMLKAHSSGTGTVKPEYLLELSSNGEVIYSGVIGGEE